MVLTCGYDRSLVCYKPGKDQLVFNLPTFSSRITCMVQNVQDPSVLALGCGDGQIRIWKSNSHKTMYDYISIWQKMSRCEILALAWHPTRDGLLAFATDEGRIGNVPLFVNLIFIFYPRWRFKLGGFFLQTKIAWLVIREKSNFCRFVNSISHKRCSLRLQKSNFYGFSASIIHKRSSLRSPKI